MPATKPASAWYRTSLIALFDKILAADCIAVASPIYSMGITAELKSLIDRAQYLWARKFILKTLYFTARTHKTAQGPVHLYRRAFMGQCIRCRLSRNHRVFQWHGV